MRPIARILRYAWAIYFLLLFCVVFLLLYPLFRLLLWNERTYPAAHALRRIWGYCIMYPAGLWPKTLFEFKPDRSRAYIYVANHFSYLDILSLNVQLPTYFRFMAKAELGRIPLFKIFFRTIDISVERGNVQGAIEAYKMATEALTAGDSLGIFPEGGIGTSIPEMRRFKSGAFKLAIEHSIPIVPISILDNWKRLPSGGIEAGGTPGRMRMIVHHPIYTENFRSEDAGHLSQQVYDLIQNTFNRHNFAP